MKYVIDFTLNELKAHYKFKPHHTDRQAEAIYEMLTDFENKENFIEVVSSYLKDKGIVTKHYEYDDVPRMGWGSLFDESYLVVKLT